VDLLVRSSLLGSASYLVAEVEYPGCLQRPDEVELDVLELQLRPVLLGQGRLLCTHNIVDSDVTTCACRTSSLHRKQRCARLARRVPQ
jgi:hypothetical protein